MNKIITHETAVDVCALKPELRQIAKKLSTFPLGQFLLKNRGLNGKWTSYLIHTTTSENVTENQLLSRSPVILATRERFDIFQKQLMKYLKPKTVVASIPCGVMDDLLTLPQVPKDTVFLGCDLDAESLGEVGKRLLVGQNVQLLRQDAWDLGIDKSFDIIVSNGLNIYEEDDERVTDLYRNFYKALKSGGVLITSFLTPKDAWHDYNSEDLAWQKTIFVDILQVKWQSLRSEEITREQLKSAGFEVLDVIYDKQGMFPTIVARKR